MKDSELYAILEKFIYNDLYDIFDGKVSYGYRFEAPVDGNLTAYEKYCRILDNLNDIICRYIYSKEKIINNKKFEILW